MRRKSARLKTLTKISVWIVASVLLVGPSLLHSQFGIGVSPILTGSMRPYANPGDVFVTTPIKASALKVGDIISVHSQETGIFYAHRINEIRIQSNILRITTKGDANGAPEVDPLLVGADKSVSKVVMTLNWIGRPLIYLSSIQGRQASYSFLIIANLVALFLYIFKKREVIEEVIDEFVHNTDLVLAQKQIEIQQREIGAARALIDKFIAPSIVTIFQNESNIRFSSDKAKAMALANKK